MEQAPENKYLQAKVLTASPEQLQLMLYDGCIRFCEQARTAIEQKQIEPSYKLLSRAEAIILELCNSLREEVAPEPCANMRRLYMYCYERLVTANIKKDLTSLDDAPTHPPRPPTNLAPSDRRAKSPTKRPRRC